MSDVPAETPEVVPGNTPEPSDAAPAAQPEAPVSGENPNPESQEPSEAKTYSKDELEKIVAKERARERRRVERELNQKPPAPAPQAPVAAESGEPKKPSISEFATVEEYDQAMEKYADKKVEYKEAQRERTIQESRRASEQQELIAAHEDREETARERYPDYDTITGNARLPITAPMADAIRLAENGPDIAYFLGKNVAEAARISKLSPFAQVKEIGRLEATVKASPPIPDKPQSAAPEPITPVRPRGGAGYTSLDDPRALKQLGSSGLIDAWNEQARKQNAQRNSR